MNTFKEIWNELAKHSKINIYTHAGPDGDSIGACIGLKRMILHQWKDKIVKVISIDTIAGKLATCDAVKEIQTFDEEADVYVYPDTPQIKMVGVSHSPSINIDHHAVRSIAMDLEFVKIWPSCCGLLLDEFKKLELTITPYIAEALLIGAVTDTGYGLYGDAKNRAQALKDIAELDSLCQKYTREYVNTFWGLSLEQEKIFTQLLPYIQIQGNVMTLAVPDTIANKLSLADLRTITQELTHRIPTIYYIWSYIHNNEYKYSVRGERKSMLEFVKKYNGGGHNGAGSFISTKKPLEVFEDFIQFTSN